MKVFLLAQLPIGAEQGTRHLAKALVRGFQNATGDDHEGMLGAILKARTADLGRTSLSTFAKKEVPEGARAKFLEGVNEEHKASLFEVSKPILKEYLGRYIVTTTDHVTISAPSEQVGRHLKLTVDGEKKYVDYHGEVTNERISRASETRQVAAKKVESPAKPRKKAHG